MSPSHADSTVSHQPRSAPAQPSTAPPVVVVRDAAPDDPALHQFVRRRARLGGVLLLAIWVLLLARDQATADDRYAGHRVAIFAVSVAAQGVLTGLVWVRRRLSIRQYNVLWTLSLAVLAGGIAAVQIDTFRRPELMERLFADGYRTILGVQFASGWGAMWFTLIMCDAALYPRTALWTLGLGVAVGFVSAGVCAAAYLTNPAMAPADLWSLVSQLLFWVAIGTGFGMLAQRRLETLQKQTEQARRFGQYRLTGRLDHGGMGEVYLAEHLLLKRPSVIKMVRADRAGDAAMLARFEREVKMLATLTHPNTVQVFDYGHTSDGTFYYVMEYLPGLDLDRLVDDHGPLPPGRVVYLLRQVCRALSEAHAAGLIHRDVKPSNVMVCARGGVPDVAKLLDFGLVRADAGASDRLTTSGSIMGTPSYMSPEQAGGLPADARSDVYSLGASAYFLLTGRPVFRRATPMLTVAAHLNDPPPQLGPDVPADLAEVVMRCLAKKPDDRFAGSRDLEGALATCVCAADWDEDRAAEWWATRRPDFAPPGGQRQTTLTLGR